MKILRRCGCFLCHACGTEWRKHLLSVVFLSSVRPCHTALCPEISPLFIAGLTSVSFPTSYHRESTSPRLHPYRRAVRYRAPPFVMTVEHPDRPPTPATAPAISLLAAAVVKVVVATNLSSHRRRPAELTNLVLIRAATPSSYGRCLLVLQR